ncbi:MAG TPA: cellulase family glycosylhydrolase [Xanthobacteraceae bacterium]|nr:cellulase family glycosylhydrolase [Xanthobacteraceae bacterium]
MRPAWLVAPAIAICVFVAAVARLPALAADSAPAFRRGATLVEFFEFPKIVGDGADRTYADPAYPHPQSALALFDFDELHRIGFDHMRVPLDVGPLLQGDAQEQEDILKQLVAVVSAINRHGLAVLVTLFPPSLHHELPQTYLDGLDGPKFRAYVAVVERVASALAAVDSGVVALEPMNEPQSQCRIHFGTDWTAYQQAMVERIRRISARLPLFLTGGCWSNIEGIVQLDTDLLHDRHNYVSVHFYYPFLFTHQSATWSMPYLAGTIGLPYPAAAGSLRETLELTRARFRAVKLSDGIDRAAAEAQAEAEIGKYFSQAQGPAQIAEWMDKVAEWQRREGVESDRIVFTEFGAMKQTIGGMEIGRASRARWLRDTSASIESHGWGWTAYVLRDDPFGLYVHESDRNPDPELMRALHLNDPLASPAE